MTEDNWENRVEKMICKTCMYYVPKNPVKVGRCRRHAPTMAGFPVMFETDFCGDHKIDENRINGHPRVRDVVKKDPVKEVGTVSGDLF